MFFSIIEKKKQNFDEFLDFTVTSLTPYKPLENASFNPDITQNTLQPNPAGNIRHPQE